MLLAYQPYQASIQPSHCVGRVVVGGGAERGQACHENGARFLIEAVRDVGLLRRHIGPRAAHGRYANMLVAVGVLILRHELEHCAAVLRLCGAVRCGNFE